MVTKFHQHDMQLQRLPLAGVRVVEISDGKTEMCGRFLADLGAEVILVEPPSGAASRLLEPLVDGISLYFATHNANKLSVTLDLNDQGDRKRFQQLIEVVDIFIDTTRPGTLDQVGLSVSTLMALKPELVVLSITEFGQTGPYRDFLATNAVHIALGGVLCRSGMPGTIPLLPPANLAYESAAVQAAWCALVAYWQRLHTGTGDHLDFSIHEATAQVLDPALGVTGSAAAGASARSTAVRDRPPPIPLYPTLRCADGYVRVCILNPRQWDGMSAWMGASHEFSDPSFRIISNRLRVIGRVNQAIGELFREQRVADLVAEGQRRGVPIAPLATPAAVLADDHFADRGAFVPFEVAPGLVGSVPSGFLEVNSVRAGIRKHAPNIGAHNEYVFGAGGVVDMAAQGGLAPLGTKESVGQRRPFAGLRVLDLGVIVAGAELGRMFADQGAEVIKIENRAFPDGLRQALHSDALMTPSFAAGHRGKQSMGINLKTSRGVNIFKQLVAKSDVILSNFKPGTLDSLGLGYSVLKEVNPRIVMADSSALGSTGPQSRSLGYGPLVRMMTGLTSLWCYPDKDNSFCDCNTIYPDHAAARVVAVGALAELISAKRSAQGGTVSVSQAEIFLTSTSEYFLQESIRPGSFVSHGNASPYYAPEGVFQCAGDDEWCVVSVQENQQWANLATAIGRPELLKDERFSTARGRVQHRNEVEANLEEWTRTRTPVEVMQVLQAAGVPAGKMVRLYEYDTDPQLQARGFFRTLHQPGLPDPIVTENGPTKALRLPDPEMRPAPYQAEHTREVASRVLGLSGSEIDDLITSGDLEVMPPPKGH